MISLLSAKENAGRDVTEQPTLFRDLYLDQIMERVTED